MDTREKNDQRIIELFSASRQVDRASASDFRTLLGSARTRRLGRRRVGTTPRRLLTLSLATTAAGALLAVVSYSFLLERTDRMAPPMVGNLAAVRFSQPSPQVPSGAEAPAARAQVARDHQDAPAVARNYESALTLSPGVSDSGAK